MFNDSKLHIPEILGKHYGYGIDRVMSVWKFIEPRAEFMPASANRHQNWPGGLHDHLAFMLVHARGHMDLLGRRPDEQDFSLSDLGISILLHDYEKCWKYQPRDEVGRGPFDYDRECLDPAWPPSVACAAALMKHLDLDISLPVLNALQLSEGGWSAAARQGGDIRELGVLVHAADLCSAKIHTDLTGWGHRKWQLMSTQERKDKFADLEARHPRSRFQWPS